MSQPVPGSQLRQERAGMSIVRRQTQTMVKRTWLLSGRTRRLGRRCSCRGRRYDTVTQLGAVQPSARCERRGTEFSHQLNTRQTACYPRDCARHGAGHATELPLHQVHTLHVRVRQPADAEDHTVG